MYNKRLEQINVKKVIESYEEFDRKDFSNFCIVGDGHPVFSTLNRPFLNVNFQGSQFLEISFEGARFKDVNFKYANLKEVRFQQSEFIHADFSHAKMEEANLEYARFMEANFYKCSLKYAQLQNCHLEGANFEGADLSSANFHYAYLKGAKFKGATVRGTNFLGIENDINELLDEKQLKQAKYESDSIYASQKSTAQNYNISGINSSKELHRIIKEIQKAYINRLGQPKFRKELLNAYNKCCAISGCDIEQTLEAAHIIPYCINKNNNVINGLLLRADLHTLFDLNLIKINPEDYIIDLDSSLRSNKIYAYFQGEKLILPKYKHLYPSYDSLKWRYEYYHEYAPNSSL